MQSSPDALSAAKAVLIRYCGEFSPDLITQAKGSYVYTESGRKILDFTSGQMCSVFGHNHPKILAALTSASDNALHLLSSMLSPAVVEFCQGLIETLPAGLEKAILLNTGSESVEVAIRMAKLATGGFEVIGFAGSWHGMTAGAQSYTYSKTRIGYGPNIPGCRMLPAPYAYRCPIRHCQGKCDNSCLEVGFEQIDRQSVGAGAAMVAEPVLSAAGIIELSADYTQRLKELCDERGLYLIFDEAQTAFGRLGLNYAFEDLGVVPDFLALSKTMGGGLPLSAMVTSSEIEQLCYEKGFVYVTSHVSDPLPAAVGLATLDILLNEKMAQLAREKGDYLKKQLQELQQRHECIGDVRGKGMLLGIEIVKDRQTKTPAPELGHRIGNRCYELGLSMNIVRIKGYGGVFRIAPPLTISYADLDLGVEILDRAISEVMAK